MKKSFVVGIIIVCLLAVLMTVNDTVKASSVQATAKFEEVYRANGFGWLAQPQTAQAVKALYLSKADLSAKSSMYQLFHIPLSREAYTAASPLSIQDSSDSNGNGWTGWIDIPLPKGAEPIYRAGQDGPSSVLKVRYWIADTTADGPVVIITGE